MDERTRPARDLLAQVRLTAPRRIVDMGCGPGNSTELLVARYPDAAITGLDNSPAMLAAARKALPALTFSEADAASWVPDAGVDLVFANAIYQWVPEHLDVLPRLLAAMGAGGCLAVQMPDNLAEPTHRLMIETARSGPWADRLAAAAAARAPLPPVRAYYDALRPYAAHLDIWHSVYNHVLDGPAAVVDWVRGTGLRPFLEPLTSAEQADFLARYTDAIAAAYPPAADGKVLLRFPRLFIVATRGP
jgi:trans-aconitate 2-methyltransferase